MTVVADPDFFSSEAHQSLDVVGIGRHSGMLHRFEDDGVAALRIAEVVGESVDHEPVARFDAAANDGFAFLEGALGQGAIVIGQAHVAHEVTGTLAHGGAHGVDSASDLDIEGFANKAVDSSGSG